MKSGGDWFLKCVPVYLLIPPEYTTSTASSCYNTEYKTGILTY